MAKNLIAAGYWADYEHHFLTQAATELDYLKVVNFKYHKPSRVAKLAAKFAYKSPLTSVVKPMINADDVMLLQDNKHCLRLADKLREDMPVAILCRDPISNRPKIRDQLIHLHNNNIKIWSFDDGDCKRYGFTPYWQFISPVQSVQDQKQDTDLAFLGRDKGREQMLRAFGELAKQCGLASDIHVYQANESPMAYTDYLKRVLKARCIIDVNQAGQVGLTLRPLEALLYQRKLISNNASLKMMDFYHPNNVLVFENDVLPDALERFMNLPLDFASFKNAHRYKTSSVINHIYNTFT